MTDAERLEEITEAHHECRDDHKGPYVPHCAECGGSWPCGTVLLVAEVERLRGVVEAVRAIHRPVLVNMSIDAVCAACCTEVWPCETVAALAETEGKP